jgi:putative heme iron utilization protein
MASRLKTLIDLLHGPGELAFASHSVALPGFPFATVVPFATDEQHRPLLLISRLAEHTRNLAADPRASVSVARALGDGEIARASLLGNLVEIEAPPLLVARYLRFHPAAERFLELGDFRFHRFDPLRIRVVGGFAQAGWLDARQLLEAPHIALEDEARLIEASQELLPPGRTLLGIDAYGIDYRVDAQQKRIAFKSGPVLADVAESALRRAFASI